MKFQGALIREQGVTFAIIIVKKSILDSSISSNETIANSQSLFPGVPIILMAQDHSGVPRYYGRQDIVNFLIKVPLKAIPWKEYWVN